MTSTSSSVAIPPVITSSSVGRKASMRSGVSMMVTATGTSSLRLRSRSVWIWFVPPYPSNPRMAVAPARPAAKARCTISTNSGRWCHWSVSPT